MADSREAGVQDGGARLRESLNIWLPLKRVTHQNKKASASANITIPIVANWTVRRCILFDLSLSSATSFRGSIVLNRRCTQYPNEQKNCRRPCCKHAEYEHLDLLIHVALSAERPRRVNVNIQTALAADIRPKQSADYPQQCLGEGFGR